MGTIRLAPSVNKIEMYAGQDNDLVLQVIDPASKLAIDLTGRTYFMEIFSVDSAGAVTSILSTTQSDLSKKITLDVTQLSQGIVKFKVPYAIAAAQTWTTAKYDLTETKSGEGPVAKSRGDVSMIKRGAGT